MIPYFIMLIGPAGCGKSTYADTYDCTNRLSPHVILSSDKIREELYGSASVQTNPNKVFKIMLFRAIQALNEGKTVVYDATNLKRKFRVETLDILSNQVLKPFRKKAVILAISKEVAKQRNQQRDRKVADYVIDRMFEQFQWPTYDEGWDEIQEVV